MSRIEDQEKLRTALSFHQAGELDQAADLYRQLISGDLKNFQALHYLGVVEASRGNFEQAESLMDRSISLTQPNVQFVDWCILCWRHLRTR
jgi:Flp pilus assembly protein TadD